MTHLKNTSSVSLGKANKRKSVRQSKSTKSASSIESRKQQKSTVPKRNNTNWHEAASCAVQIELRDYSHLLEFKTEYILGKNNYRIDILIIKKLCEQPIPKNIANIFKTFNLFEVKGMGSSVNTDCYYKTIGYAGLLINQTGRTNQYINTDVTLSFLSLHYPRNLIKHLRDERKLMVAKFSPGVYHIINEIFSSQIIVTSELSPDDNLYLRCLTDKLKDIALVNRLAEDYSNHQEQDIYRKYMNQLANANTNSKGESTMVCEGIFKICGTSYEEVYEHARKKAMDDVLEEAKKEADDFYLSKIDELNSSIKHLSSQNDELNSSVEQLSSQNDKLRDLLIKNNISFNLT